MPNARSKNEKVVNIFMPSELKDKIKIQAIKEKLSMNEYIVRILSETIKKAEHCDK